MNVVATGIALVTSLATPRTASAFLPQDGAAACSTSAERARRLELSDGRIVSVDVQSVAVSNGTVMAVGRHAYVFPRSANSRTSPGLQDTIIGVVIDGRGNVSPVHRPLRESRVFFPRVAAARDGSFHVLFATGIDTSDAAPIRADTASIWYARFANGAWTARERIAEVRGAALHPEYASDLVEQDGSLSFLFPFDDGRVFTSDRGVILLRRRGRTWTADTLRTLLMPTAVRARHAPRDASLLVLLAQSVSNGAPRAEKLYLARFDSTWTEPRWIAGDGVRPVTLPIAANLGDGVIASWVSWQPMVPRTSVVEWLRIHPGGRTSTGAAIDSGEATFPFEMIVVDDAYPLWLYRGEPYGMGLALAVATDTIVTRLGGLTIPFHNPRARAIALSPTRILLFTMKRAITDAEPMIASYSTVFEIRCPRSVRR
jgi:hypothetical protein